MVTLSGRAACAIGITDRCGCPLNARSPIRLPQVSDTPRPSVLSLRETTAGDFAKTLDRRAHFRMAQPLPSSRQGLGSFDRLLRRLAIYRINPAYDTSHRKSTEMNSINFESDSNKTYVCISVSFRSYICN